MAPPASQRELDTDAAALPEQATTEAPPAAASALGVPVCATSPTSPLSGYLSVNDSDMTDDDVGFRLVTRSRQMCHSQKSYDSASAIISSKPTVQPLCYSLLATEFLSVAATN